jgi:DNA N-6-adenine-methyltransferase (Dam)
MVWQQAQPELGHADYGFTLDGASEPRNGLLPLSSTAEEPIDWKGHRVFCNPPWSNIRPFVELAVLADLAVLLVPARTNSRWFHRALDLGAEVRFFAGRPSFVKPDSDQRVRNCSPVDCVLLVFSKQTLSR